MPAASSVWKRIVKSKCQKAEIENVLFLTRDVLAAQFAVFKLSGAIGRIRTARISPMQAMPESVIKAMR